MDKNPVNLNRVKEAIRITLNGLFINLFLVLIKLAAGFLGRSSAMVADGFHSLSDLVSDVFLLFGLRYVDRPPDKTHNYGHGKIETLLTSVISLLILVTGFLILTNSSFLIFDQLLGGDRLLRPSWIAFAAAAISIFFKEILFFYTKKIGEKTNNNAIIANAWHHRSDSLSSVATLLGIGGAVFFGNQWVILDPVAAMLVSIFILTIGVKMLKKSIMEMLEASIGEEKEKEIVATINSVEGVISLHNLRTRKIGNYIAIDVHIEVNRHLNIVQAHDIATEVEKQLQHKFGTNNMISVHTEPYNINPVI